MEDDLKFFINGRQPEHFLSEQLEEGPVRAEVLVFYKALLYMLMKLFLIWIYVGFYMIV